MKTRQVEVAIIGGGPAGASAALLLGRAGVSVALVERTRYEQTRVGEALPPRVRLVLGELGVWDAFVRAGHVPSVGNHSSWGHARLLERSFLFDPYGCGWHVDRRRFDELLTRNAESAGAEVLLETRLLGSERREGGWSLQLGGPGGTCTMQADFVIDASGRSAVFARQRGAMRRRLDRLMGVVGCLGPGSRGPMAPSAAATLVEATDQGWWYSAPLPEGRMVIAFMGDADLIAASRLTRAEVLAERCRQAPWTALRTAEYLLMEGPRVVPSWSSCLDTVAGPGWMAIGDAAMTFDPLSSQGVLKALLAGVEGAQVVLGAREGGGGMPREYQARVAEQFAGYTRAFGAYYQLERRWMDAPFWRRRHSMVLELTEHGSPSSTHRRTGPL